VKGDPSVGRRGNGIIDSRRTRTKAPCRDADSHAPSDESRCPFDLAEMRWRRILNAL
jgi:hypothetical protein